MLHPNTFNPTECHCRFKYIFWHTVTLKMEIRSHFLEVQCQGNLGAVSSAWVLFVPLHNVSGDNAFWNVFPSRDWNTQSFQRRKFLWLYFMPIFYEPELRWKNVRNFQQRKSSMKRSKMLKRPWGKFHSRSLHFHSGNTDGDPHPKIQLQLLLVLFEQITCSPVVPLHGRASLSYREHFPGLTVLCSSIGFKGFSQPFFSQRGGANALTSQAF